MMQPINPAVRRWRQDATENPDAFWARALADRIKASGSRLVFTADKTYRKGKDVPLKGLVDAAMDLDCDCVEHVIMLQRGGVDAPMRAGRDLGWDEFLARGEGQSGEY